MAVDSLVFDTPLTGGRRLVALLAQGEHDAPPLGAVAERDADLEPKDEPCHDTEEDDHEPRVSGARRRAPSVDGEALADGQVAAREGRDVRAAELAGDAAANRRPREGGLVDDGRDDAAAR
jgi:hypothetical protein